MSLVTRVSVAFLVALALALGGFSACLYYLAGLRLRLDLDQELEATLDRFPDRAEGLSGRVTWAIYDEAGRRVEGPPDAGRPMVLDGRDLGPLAVDVATTIAGPDGLRWRVLARRIGGGAAVAGRPRPRARNIAQGPGAGRAQGARARPRRTRLNVLAAWASLEPVEAEIRSLAAILPLISLVPLGAGRGDRPSFRPARPRPARRHGRVGTHHAFRRLAGCPIPGRATSWRTSPAVSTGSSTACTWRWSGSGSSPARRRTSSARRWPP